MSVFVSMGGEDTYLKECGRGTCIYLHICQCLYFYLSMFMSSICVWIYASAYVYACLYICVSVCVQGG